MAEIDLMILNESRPIVGPKTEVGIEEPAKPITPLNKDANIY